MRNVQTREITQAMFWKTSGNPVEKKGIFSKCAHTQISDLGAAVQTQ